jgi:hypothetical protein
MRLRRVKKPVATTATMATRFSLIPRSKRKLVVAPVIGADRG